MMAAHQNVLLWLINIYKYIGQPNVSIGFGFETTVITFYDAIKMTKLCYLKSS